MVLLPILFVYVCGKHSLLSCCFSLNFVYGTLFLQKSLLLMQRNVSIFGFILPFASYAINPSPPPES